MEVQRELRPGHKEKVYQYRLADRLKETGYQVEIEKRIEVYVNDFLAGYMYLDLWIEQCLAAECKAFSHELTKDEIGQVVTYLAATGSPVGMIYNFGCQILEFRRILPPKSTQDWHKHLYRCIWTPPGYSLPPIDQLESSAPLRFSVVSQPTESVSVRLSDSYLLETTPSPPSSSPISIGQPATSVSVRLSDSHPLETTPPPPSSSPISIGQPAASVSVRLSDSYPFETAPSASSPLYASAGVNIDAGNRAVDLMRDAVRSTYGPEVLAGIGSFGGLFSAAALKELDDPVLVASTDGVGTKVKLAAQAGRYDSIGHDIVNHCLNDILVQGARPLFFLDYIASAQLDPEMIAAVVKGAAVACREAGCALLGGETAEMPGVYQPHEFDVAGTIVGVVERAHLLPRPTLQAGDVLVGIRSSGPHTNGYSLIRKIFAGVPLDTVFPELGLSLADALLMPHRSYLPILQSSISNPASLRSRDYRQQSAIKALAHLTGGGFLENIPRVLPAGLNATIHLGSWPIPPLFTLIQQRGEIEAAEMYRVFNMGIGMIAIVDRELVTKFQAAIPEETFVIGELVPGEKKTILIQ